MVEPLPHGQAWTWGGHCVRKTIQVRHVDDRTREQGIEAFRAGHPPSPNSWTPFAPDAPDDAQHQHQRRRMKKPGAKPDLALDLFAELFSALPNLGELLAPLPDLADYERPLKPLRAFTSPQRT
jgi:hypothetical protein